MTRACLAARGRSDPTGCETRRIRHRDTETQRLLGFLCGSVSPWLIALGLAGRVDFHHGLLAVVVAVTLSAREADAQNLQSFDPLKGTYAELVSMYESGHRAEAVRWMTWWPASHFRTGIEKLARDPNPRRIEVAIVLHTDVATSADVGRHDAVAHLAIIQPLLQALSDRRRFAAAPTNSSVVGTSSPSAR
jgi:hypothetical protein